MNKYPLWKYVIIALAILVSVIYAAPNLFGEVPAVQVSGARASVKVDDALRTGIEEALKLASVPLIGTELEEAKLRLRFADTDTQLKARDVIQAKVGKESPEMAWSSAGDRGTSLVRQVLVGWRRLAYHHAGLWPFL